MAYFDAEGNRVSARDYRRARRDQRRAERAGEEYTGNQYYTGQQYLDLVGNYYSQTGRRLNARQTADYLRQLAAAQAAGRDYTGPNYMSEADYEAAHGGFDADIIRGLGRRADWLSLAPGEYTRMTEDELQAAAENRFAMTYGLQAEAARKARDANIEALEQQRPTINENYDSQKLSSNKQHLSAYDSLNGAMTSRGLGRSSYAAAAAGNQLLARDTAANAIEGQRTNALNNLQAQITAEGTNYNNTIATLEANRANEVANYMDTLRQREFENELNATNARNDFLEMLRRLPRLRGGKGNKKPGSNGTGGGGDGTGTPPNSSSPGAGGTDDAINGGRRK